jgi:hypothetical protein
MKTLATACDRSQLDVQARLGARSVRRSRTISARSSPPRRAAQSPPSRPGGSGVVHPFRLPSGLLDGRDGERRGRAVLDRDRVPEVAEQLVHPPKVVREEPITVAWHRHHLRGSDHRLDADTLRGRVDQVRGLCHRRRRRCRRCAAGMAAVARRSLSAARRRSDRTTVADVAARARRPSIVTLTGPIGTPRGTCGSLSAGGDSGCDAAHRAGGPGPICRAANRPESGAAGPSRRREGRRRRL